MAASFYLRREGRHRHLGRHACRFFRHRSRQMRRRCRILRQRCPEKGRRCPPPPAPPPFFSPSPPLQLAAPPPAVSRTHPKGASVARSEEHTSELQSLMRSSYAAFF